MVDVSESNMFGGPSMAVLFTEFTLRDVLAHLRAGVDPNGQISDGGVTPLMHVLEGYVYPDLVDMLLEFGASASVVDERGQGVIAQFITGYGLREYIGSDDEDDKEAIVAVIMHLARHGAPVDAPDTYGFTPLMRLCQQVDQPYLVDLLVTNGADVNRQDLMGRTPLCFAASHGARYDPPYRSYGTMTIRHLLEAGADPRHVAPDGHTPLVAAIQAGNPPTVSVLLEAGATTVLSPSHRHLEPIFSVIARDLPRLHAAREQGVPLDFPTATYQTALMWAAIVGDLEAANYLLENGADPNARDSSKWTPLVFAVDQGDEAICTLLLECGADPNSRIVQTCLTDWSRRPYNTLGWALARNEQDPERKSHRAICDLLRSYGASIEEAPL